MTDRNNRDNGEDTYLYHWITCWKVSLLPLLLENPFEGGSPDTSIVGMAEEGGLAEGSVAFGGGVALSVADLLAAGTTDGTIVGVGLIGLLRRPGLECTMC